MISLQRIYQYDLRDIKKEAEKEGIIFCNKTELFGIFINDNLIAFGGMILYNNKTIIKNLYVTEKHRGYGYFKLLTNHLIDINKHKRIEANCTKYSLRYFLKKGFKVEKVFKNGITKVVYEIL